ncbi:MAG: hypothetical protein P1V51_20045 [Deltaproteobacteria bacterium]|nr:hypothetical protein [Deltaproteobacteria bacterium]
MGGPAVDPVVEDTFGAAWGTGAPYAGDFALPENLDNYQAEIFREVVRRTMRRKDLYLSETLASIESPLNAAFAQTVGLEALRPMNVTAPASPAVARRRVVFTAGSEYVHEFGAVEITAWSEQAMTFGCELVFTDDTRSTTVEMPVLAGTWDQIKFLIPPGFSRQRIKQVRVGIQNVPLVTNQFRIGRVSLLYAASPLPAPVIG